eukprot:8022970-Alexandrium_andersonii.AAC.1
MRLCIRARACARAGLQAHERACASMCVCTGTGDLACRAPLRVTPLVGRGSDSWRRMCGCLPCEPACTAFKSCRICRTL